MHGLFSEGSRNYFYSVYLILLHSVHGIGFSPFVSGGLRLPPRWQNTQPLPNMPTPTITALTPKTDAELSRLRLSFEDESAGFWVYYDGKQIEGDLVRAEFARKLECENAALLEALKISRGNVASLNASHPAVWGEWLKVIDAALAKAEGSN